MSKCFDCESRDTKRYYVTVRTKGAGAEIGYVRNLCPKHYGELAVELKNDQSCEWSIVPIEQHEAEREAEKIFCEVMREAEREIRERGERELLRMLDL